MGVEHGPGKDIGPDCFRTLCWERYLHQRGKK